MSHIMVDLETYDNKPTAAIISIGAVVFDPKGDRMPMDKKYDFYVVVDLQSSLALGLTQSEGTAKWWAGQSEDARKVFTDPSIPVMAALQQFKEWMHSFGGPKSHQVWGNGADFDNAILGTAYGLAGINLPWMFWNNKCFRTLKSLAKERGFVEPSREGTYHNALDDARHQAMVLQRIYAFLEL